VLGCSGQEEYDSQSQNQFLRDFVGGKLCHTRMDEARAMEENVGEDSNHYRRQTSGCFREEAAFEMNFEQDFSRQRLNEKTSYAA
jgi:hypothetical protein